MQQLFAALKASGAMPDAIRASSLEIRPQNEYRDGKNVFVGTQVGRSIDATFDNLDKLRSFIAQLPADPEVLVENTRVWRSDINQIRLDLRKRAIVNSQQAAQKIAAAYGMHIKSVYSVSEVAPNFAYGIEAGSWDNVETYNMVGLPAPPADRNITVTASSIPTDLRVGSIEVQQNIYAVYLTSP